MGTHQNPQNLGCDRWHVEMAQLNGVARALIRMAFGTSLSPGSHQEALACYLRAAELNPTRLIHRCCAASTQ